MREGDGFFFFVIGLLVEYAIRAADLELPSQ